jgi:hypothetical protein
MADDYTERAVDDAPKPPKLNDPAVVLVEEDERLRHVSGSSVFYYRRLPSPVRNRLEQRHTKRGNLQWGSFMDSIMRWCLLGWDGVTNRQGEAVPFDPELIEKLPADLQVELQDKMGAKASEEDAHTGN